MKSDLELAVEASKRLESLLEKHYGASGRGLHEKLSSVEERLPVQVVREVRFIATLRNKIVHEADTEKLRDRKRFCTTVERVARALTARPANPRPARVRKPWRTRLLLARAFPLVTTGVAATVGGLLAWKSQLSASACVLAGSFCALLAFCWPRSAAALLLAGGAGWLAWPRLFS